jgi:hypothetical protein
VVQSKGGGGGGGGGGTPGGGTGNGGDSSTLEPGVEPEPQSSNAPMIIGTVVSVLFFGGLTLLSCILYNRARKNRAARLHREDVAKKVAIRGAAKRPENHDNTHEADSKNKYRYATHVSDTRAALGDVYREWFQKSDTDGSGKIDVKELQVRSRQLRY